MRLRPFWFFSVVLSLALAAPVAAQQEDVGPGAPTFKEGDVITMDKIDTLKPFLPQAGGGLLPALAGADDDDPLHGRPFTVALREGGW